MTPEERSLLERTYKLAEDNNKILRSIRRSNRLAIIMRVIYWILILVIGYGAYYFIQPYLTSMLGLIGGSQNEIQGVSNSVMNAQNAANQLRDLIK